MGGGAQTMRAGLRDAKAFKQFAKLARCRLEFRRRARRPEHTARCRHSSVSRDFGPIHHIAHAVGHLMLPLFSKFSRDLEG